MLDQSMPNPQDSAGLKAEQQASLLIDFDLEDIIAGNIPDGEAGKAIQFIVESAQDLSTQGKIEAALIPIYEAVAAEFYRQEGGTAHPPIANRHNIQEHAKKVLQARKVKRTEALRAAKLATIPAKPTTSITRFQIVAVVCLVIAIAAVVYVRL